MFESDTILPFEVFHVSLSYCIFIQVPGIVPNLSDYALIVPVHSIVV